MDDEAAAVLNAGTPHIVHSDGSVGADKFFYTAKASTSERDKGLENLPTSDGRNPHPTVKLLEIAAVFGRVDDLDTLPARQREAVARDNHVRGLLLEIAAVFGSIDDLDTLPARVREAAARGSS